MRAAPCKLRTRNLESAETKSISSVRAAQRCRAHNDAIQTHRSDSISRAARAGDQLPPVRSFSSVAGDRGKHGATRLRAPVFPPSTRRSRVWRGQPRGRLARKPRAGRKRRTELLSLAPEHGEHEREHGWGEATVSCLWILPAELSCARGCKTATARAHCRSGNRARCESVGRWPKSRGRVRDRARPGPRRR